MALLYGEDIEHAIAAAEKVFLDQHGAVDGYTQLFRPLISDMHVISTVGLRRD